MSLLLTNNTQAKCNNPVFMELMAFEILILHELNQMGIMEGKKEGKITLASISNPFCSHLMSISHVPKPWDIKCTFLPLRFFCLERPWQVKPSCKDFYSTKSCWAQLVCVMLLQETEYAAENKTLGDMISNTTPKEKGRITSLLTGLLPCLSPVCMEKCQRSWDSLHKSNLSNSTSTELGDPGPSSPGTAIIFQQAMLSNNCLLKSSHYAEQHFHL